MTIQLQSNLKNSIMNVMMKIILRIIVKNLKIKQIKLDFHVYYIFKQNPKIKLLIVSNFKIHRILMKIAFLLQVIIKLELFMMDVIEKNSKMVKFNTDVSIHIQIV